MIKLNGKDILFSSQIHINGYEDGYADGQESMVDKSKIIEKTTTGTDILSLDDVSEVPHKLKVSLQSKNKIPYPFPYGNGTQTINGVTFTDNGDGTVTANGTATANAIYYLHHNISNPLSFTKGVYTLSGTPEGGAWRKYRTALSRIIDGTQEAGDQADDGGGKTVELEYVGAIYIIIYSGQTVENLVFKPQIEKGDEATDFVCGITDFSNVTVSQYGKNLFGGVDNVKYPVYLPKGTPVIVSCDAPNKPSFAWYDKDGNRTSYVSLAETTGDRKWYPITFQTDVYYVVFGLWGDDPGTNYQLEIGTKITAFEPCITKTYTPKKDGTIEGVASVSPNMTFTVDMEGVDITTTYHKSYGTQVEYNRFWDSFLRGGSRTDYLSAFTGGGWTSETLRPKYKCTPTGPASQMFYLCGYGSGQGVIDFRTIADKFDLSQVTNAASMFYSVSMDYITVDLSSATTISSAFNGGYTSKITTLTLKLTPTTTDASGAFTYQYSLKNLTFTDDSEIACNLNFKDCTALTHDSLMSIINALQDGVTSKTLTLGSTNLAKLTDAEKAKATQKGWTLA